jgi:hypothetical protein
MEIMRRTMNLIASKMHEPGAGYREIAGKIF